MSDFRNLLESVPDAYPDFVNGTIADCAEGGYEQEVRDYIERHPHADSSDITRVAFALESLRDEHPDIVYGLIYIE